MCGRYAATTPASAIAEIFKVDVLPDVLPRYNVAPTQSVIAVVADAGKREMKRFRWGLAPSWSKEGKPNAGMINARAETVAEKPAFRSAFKKRRCLVPADGFYEWMGTASGKAPYLIGMKDRRPFAMAGLWETWRDKEDPEKEPLYTCSVVTVGPNEVMEPIHDRMPLILPESAWDAWMSPDTPIEEIKALLVPYPAEEMAARPVSKAVNNARNEGPQCQADPEPAETA